ncbi:MAG: hypothetical protein ACRC5C_15175 [Bacilli bacterium]
MTSKKKPKFKVGDVVVLTLYGSVDRITNVKMVDGTFVYEVTNHEGLYVENSLMKYNEGSDVSPEVVELKWRFQYGDIVQVTGYDHEFYRIVGYRMEVWRYRNDAWEDVIYELSRVSDGEWLEADESDLVFIVSETQSAAFLRRLKADKATAARMDAQKLKTVNDYQRNPQSEQREMIDALLDVYNDYEKLYTWFGDSEYHDVMDLVRRNFQKLISQKKK